MSRMLSVLLAVTWGASGQKPELVLQTGPVDVAAVLAFSPDQTTLAAMAESGKAVRLYSVATGAELSTLDTGANTSADVPGALQYSRDGKLLWTLVEGSFRQFDARTGALQKSKTFDLGGRHIEGWHITADGRLAFGEDDEDRKGAVVLDLELGVEMKPGYRILAIDADGKLAITGTPDTPVASRKEPMYRWPLRDLATGRPAGGLEPMGSLFTSKGRRDLMQSFRTLSTCLRFYFSADGKQVACTEFEPMTNRQSVVLFDLPAGKVRKVPLAAGARSHGSDKTLALTADLKLAAAAGSGSEVSITDLAAGRTVAKFAAGTAQLAALQFSRDGKLLATVGVDRSMAIWDVTGAAAGNVTRLRGMGESALPVHALEFTADGRSLVVGTTQSVNAWDLASGIAARWLSVPFEAPQTEFGANESRARFTSLSPGGKLVLAYTQLKTTLWDGRSGRELLSLHPQPGSSFAQAGFTQDGELLLLTEQSRYRSEQDLQAIQSISLQQRENVAKFIAELTKAVARKDWKKADEIQRRAEQELPKQQAEMIASIRGDIQPGAPGQPAPPSQPAFPAQEAKLVRIANGEAVWKSKVGLHGVVGMSRHGRWLIRTNDPSMSQDGATAQASCELTLLDRESGREHAAARIANCIHLQATFSPDGRRLAAEYMSFPAGSAAWVKVWEFAPQGLGREVLTVSAGKYRGALRFSPDGSRLALAGVGAQTQIVETESGQRLFELDDRGRVTRSLSFSADGKLIATGNQEASTDLWDTATGQRVASLVLLNGGSDWLAVTPDGLFDGTPAAWRQILWRFSQDLKDVAPVESYFAEFYYPGLLADIAAGKRPKAPAGLEQKDRRQPSVMLSSEGQGRSVTVRVAVAEPETGVGARDVRLFRNGTLVKAWRGDVLGSQKQAVLQIAVPVTAGENSFTAYAFNRDNIKSADATLTVRGDAGLARKGVGYVLSVGVNRYANPDYNLKYAVADAEAFGDEVAAQQKKLGAYEKVEALALKDGDATRSRILESLKALAARAQPEDMVALYFAGHGAARGARFYLIPHDLGYAGPRNRLDAAAAEAIVAHSISDQDLESAMEGLNAGHVLLVIDACNSGQALEAEEKRRGPMNSTGLAQLAYEKGMYILTAAQSYQAALETSELGHGYLTYALVEEGLKKSAADYDAKDGQILAREWFNYATSRVPQLQERGRGSRILLLAESDLAGQQTTQQPRLFYRREGEVRPLVVAKP